MASKFAVLAVAIREARAVRPEASRELLAHLCDRLDQMSKERHDVTSLSILDEVHEVIADFWIEGKAPQPLPEGVSEAAAEFVNFMGWTDSEWRAHTRVARSQVAMLDIPEVPGS